MKKLTYSFLLLLSALFGCHLAGFGGNSLELKFNGTETLISPVAGFIAPNSSGGHSIQLTNYEVKMGKTYDFSQIRTRKNGQIRIEILILKKISTSAQPISIGTYEPKNAKEEPKDKVVRATIHQFSQNTVKNYQVFNANLTGYVKILSVNGNTVTGKIDLTDGDTKIKGAFVAQALK